MKSVLLAPNKQPDWSEVFDGNKVWWVSVKMDGTRCIILNGKAYTRAGKRFPNPRVDILLRPLLDLSAQYGYWFDMEIYDHMMEHHAQHNAVLMAHDKAIPPTMCARVFDGGSSHDWEVPCSTYRDRFDRIAPIVQGCGSERCTVVQQLYVSDIETLQHLFHSALESGYEGLMVRDPDVLYKHGRATLKEASIFKMKPFETKDGRIIEVIQRRKLKEGVVRTKNELGRTKKIHTKDSYELDDNVGALKIEFSDGTTSEVTFAKGWSLKQRYEEIWLKRKKLIGMVCEVEHMSVGAKDKLRMGRLVRLRPDKKEID